MTIDRVILQWYLRGQSASYLRSFSWKNLDKLYKRTIRSMTPLVLGALSILDSSTKIHAQTHSDEGSRRVSRPGVATLSTEEQRPIVGGASLEWLQLWWVTAQHLSTLSISRGSGGLRLRCTQPELKDCVQEDSGFQAAQPKAARLGTRSLVHELRKGSSSANLTPLADSTRRQGNCQPEQRVEESQTHTTHGIKPNQSSHCNNNITQEERQ